MVDAAELQARLSQHEVVEHPALPGRTNHLRAGVLVPVIWSHDPTIVLTRRTPRLGRHPGEISFPGGKPEPQDASLEATALREAREELGIQGAQVLGRLSSMPVYTSDFRLEPFVASVAGRFRPDPGEVAEVLTLSLGAVASWSHVDAVAYEYEGGTYLSPIVELGDALVFGATAHTLFEFLGLALGPDLPPLRAGAWTWERIQEWVASQLP